MMVTNSIQKKITMLLGFNFAHIEIIKSTWKWNLEIKKNKIFSIIVICEKKYLVINLWTNANVYTERLFAYFLKFG